MRCDAATSSCVFVSHARSGKDFENWTNEHTVQHARSHKANILSVSLPSPALHYQELGDVALAFFMTASTIDRLEDRQAAAFVIVDRS